MTRRCLSAGLLAALLLVPAFAGAGQDDDAAPDALDAELDRARLEYRAGRFGEAITALQGVVIELGKRNDQQAARHRLADAHVLLGLSYFAMRDEPATVEQFRHALGLDPSRTLDPEIYSPRVIGLFERARADVVHARGVDTNSPPASAPHGDAGLATTIAPPKAMADPALPSGTKVRITLRGAREGITGHLSDLSDRSLTLIGPDQLQLAFPREAITRLEVVKRRRSHWRKGLLIGAVAGAAGGAVTPLDCYADGSCDTKSDYIVGFSFVFGLIGGLAGGLIRTDDWVDVSPGTAAPAITTSGSPNASLTIAWRF